jgi:hypothetical protein
MLLRTLFREGPSPSIVRLHQTSGLGVILQDSADRDKFVGSFQQAHLILLGKQRSGLTAVFDNPADAEAGYHELIKAGVEPRSISLL